MSKKMIARALALIGLAGALAGCSKEKEIVLRTPGTGIRFGVTTAGSDSATRTEYSGEDENGNAVSKTSVYERVDWVPGSDRILVLCGGVVNEIADARNTTKDSIGYSMTFLKEGRA